MNINRYLSYSNEFKLYQFNVTRFIMQKEKKKVSTIALKQL